MISGLQLREDDIRDIARSCGEKIEQTSSKLEALESVAQLVSPGLDGFSRSALENPDEISLNFVELLDQIVFELSENLPADNTVREYLTDDLFSRLSIYLEIFNDPENYSNSLNKRLLTHEDTIIIRQCGMREHVPLLMSEFHEQPPLQRSIMFALLGFDGDELLNFFYTVAKERNGAEVLALALAGLKKFDAKFRYWHLLASDNEAYNRMVAYAQSFNGDVVARNVVPSDVYSFLFTLLYVESNTGLLADSTALAWIIRVLHAMLDIKYFNACTADFYQTICKLLIYTGNECLKELLKSEDQLIILIEIIDFLPREYFDRIIVKLDLLGDEFVQRVNAVVASSRIKLYDSNSNIFCYIMWKSGKDL